MIRTFAALGLGLLLTGCATPLESLPAHTATEQLLISHAAEQAASHLQLGLAAGAKVYVDSSWVGGDGAPYAVAAVRAALAAQGLALSDRAGAQVIVELRVGALSIDALDRVLGLPAMSLPTSLAAGGMGNASGLGGSTISIPELSLYSRHERKGVAEISAVALDAHTGLALGPEVEGVGTATLTSRKLVTALGWGGVQEPPGKRPAK